MKYTLLALSLATTLSATAQHNDNSLNYSVFSDYRELAPVDRNAMNVTQELAQNAFPGWSINVDKLTGNFRDLYGDAIAIPGSSLEEKVAYCMANKLNQLGVTKSEWTTQTRHTNAPHASYLDYIQQVDGHKVVFSNLSFRFTTDGRLVRIKMTSYGKPASGVSDIMDKSRLMGTPVFNEDLAGADIVTKELANDWTWFPVPGAKGYELRPAYEFTIRGTDVNNVPLDINGYIDAGTGKLLYRTNKVHDFKVRVTADSIYKENRTLPVSTQPLANMRIDIGSSTYYTNDSGWFEDGTLNQLQNTTFTLRGKWAMVRTNGGASPTFTNNINTADDSVYYFPVDLSTSTKRHVNAYYHANRIHDFMKIYLPSFTNLDREVTVNVDVPGQSCNAFYADWQTSLNFYSPGGGCNSFAEISDIIYHEYGHGICYKFYQSQGSNFSNGSLGEGNADVWGMSVLRDSVLGRFRTINSPASYIRRYDQAPKVYPIDVNGEVHNDGEIIAGSWYYVAKYIGDWDAMTTLYAKTYYDLPNGPNGTEGDVYHDVLVSAIMNDDDDANLSNGTPHLAEIVKAFAEHGIYLMTGATLAHQELAHQQPNTPATVNATLTITESTWFQSIKLFYKVRGASTWDSTTMTNTGNFNFTGQLPGFPTYSVVDYYFKVYDALGNSTFGFPNGFNTTYLANQVTIPYQFAVAVQPSHIKFDFETDVTAAGWRLGVQGDNAIEGQWVQEKPVASTYNSLIVQTGADHTTGTGKCLVTGNGSTNYNGDDIDEGATTVITPVFDMNSFVFPVVEYYRWFSNDRGNNGRSDAWQVQIRDTTSPLWSNVEFTYQSDYTWRRRVFNVREFLGNSRYVQLKFIAKDMVNGLMPGEGQNCVEAAVDDFSIYDLASSSTGISGINANRISIHPNPANSQLNIQLAIAPKTGGVIMLSDATGRIVAEEQLNADNTLYTINTSGIAAGHYLLSVKTSSSLDVKKVVIAH